MYLLNESMHVIWDRIYSQGAKIIKDSYYATKSNDKKSKFSSLLIQ